MKIIIDKDGTPLIDVPRIQEDDFGNIVVDITTPPETYTVGFCWEAVFEYNEETGEWEKLYEINGKIEEEN